MFTVFITLNGTGENKQLSVLNISNFGYKGHDTHYAVPTQFHDN